MRTNLSNVTPEEFAKREAELHAAHAAIKAEQVPTQPRPPTIKQMAQEFDRLVESGDEEAADELGKRIWCLELRRATGRPCGK